MKTEKEKCLSELFLITDKLYEKELKEISNSLKDKKDKSNKDYERLFKMFGYKKSVYLFNSKKNYGSKKYYERNPLLFLQDNVRGLYHLKNAFILGVIGNKKTTEIVNKFINKRKK